MNTFIADVGIIGCGTAGTFSAYKIAKDYPNTKCIVFEGGRGPSKRRFQMQGFLGLLPNSDGKLYMHDVDDIQKLCKTKKTRAAYNWLCDNLHNTLNTNIIDDTAPYRSTIKRIKNNGFSLAKRDYIQVIPREIHALSKVIADKLNSNINITQRFDDEIMNIEYNKKQFTITSYSGEQTMCKKLILASGRSGFRWTNQLFNEFGLTSKEKVIRYGIMAEMQATSLKEYNKANCIISNEDLEIGPLNWLGSVVPEDHYDMVLSSFRANESRWASDKVLFNVLGKHNVEDNVKQLDRIGQLTFILTNERVIKEKISALLTNKAKISILPEYNWLPEAISKIESFMPGIINGSFYTPTLLPIVPKMKLNTQLQTEHKDLILCGETTGYSGLLFAILSGIIAGDSAST